MDQNPTMKLAGAAALLVALWVAVYWLWEPARSREPGIQFERGPEGSERSTGSSRDRVTRPNPPAPGTKSDGASDRGPRDRADDRPSKPTNPTGGKPTDSGRDAPAPTTDDGSTRAPNVESGRKSDPPGTRPGGASGIVVKPPKFDEYRVEPGDTFETIARKRYGTTGLAGVIARANPFVDPRRLRPGRVILIPTDPSNIQGKVVPAPGATPAEGWKVHVVKSGDTLSSISKQHYGTVTRARAIFEANRDRMKSEHELKLNLELLIPPAEEKDGAKTDAPGDGTKDAAGEGATRGGSGGR